MDRPPARSRPGKADVFADLTAPDLPAHAVEVICQLLSASTDPPLKDLARRIARRHTFVLTAELDESGDALVKALPPAGFPM